MLYLPDDSSSISREQVTEAFLKAVRLIDKRVAPYLGKATTRVLVQGAAKRVMDAHPFLGYLTKRPYTDIHPSAIQEELSGVTPAELANGLNDLLDECFAGLRELTGDLIVPILHDEVTHQLKQL
ncbi:hypothetical protein [Ktedonospora formicarum]|uniref:Uncharacterized protein n=1 Tax=Ktedonospora formicarum TaxID=2778364 RepID=A0A8J3I4S0_9CHLR|nr:hypothetical protein [Ktedonospora formicarum]GHO45409.1 hypothetical protein KSX_35720 [Ktedonospora formicarum]